MTALHRRTAVVALVASLTFAAPLLAGCSLIPHPGGSHGVSVPGMSVGTGALPKSWPSDVPVITGEIVTGAALGTGRDQVFNATVKVSGQEAADQITTQLTGAGFTAKTDATASTDSGTFLTFTSEKWNVAVVITKTDDKTGWVANYTVTSPEAGK
ncbi:hypothetical protein [Pseudolysinimonas sp.]|uniref:hypothetical protein n=1 Tax=Pseudolysinimonas sp. TaxID=2680009 RepID=UPI003F7E9CB2